MSFSRLLCCGRRTGPSEQLPLRLNASDDEGAYPVFDNRPDPPQFCCAYLLMYVQGVGSLWAWNAYITPTDYYKVVFRGSPMEQSFLAILATTYTVIGLVTLVRNIRSN